MNMQNRAILQVSATPFVTCLMVTLASYTRVTFVTVNRLSFLWTSIKLKKQCCDVNKIYFQCTNYRISDPQNNYHLMNHYRKMETGHLNRCTVNKTRCKNDDNARSEHRIEMQSMQREMQTKSRMRNTRLTRTVKGAVAILITTCFMR